MTDSESPQNTMDADCMGPFQYVERPDGAPALYLGQRVAVIHPMEHPKQEDLIQAIEVANWTERDLSPRSNLSQKTLVAITFAASTAAGAYVEPYYHPHQETNSLARLAARLWAVAPRKYHPHILACQALTVVALSVVGDDAEFARRWLAERNIMAGIPKGSHRYDDAHFFYQAVHATICDLAGLGYDHDTNPPDPVLRKLKAHIRARAKAGALDSHAAVALMGITAWMSAACAAGRETDHVDANVDFKIMSDLIHDLHLSPALTWVRSAYNRHIYERRKGVAQR